jgi:hypothetical protein
MEGMSEPGVGNRRTIQKKPSPVRGVAHPVTQMRSTVCAETRELPAAAAKMRSARCAGGGRRGEAGEAWLTKRG